MDGNEPLDIPDLDFFIQAFEPSIFLEVRVARPVHFILDLYQMFDFNVGSGSWYVT